MDQIIAMLSKTKIILIALTALMFTGCATILHGSHQEIQVNSTPSNASVYINNVKKGTTPTSLHLKRNGTYTLAFKKDGYKPVKLHLEKNFKPLPAILGNIFWNGVLGVVVDFATGAAYKLSPEQINKHLSELESAGYLPGVTHTSKNEIDVVMLTKKQWESMK